jgi:proline racemase
LADWFTLLSCADPSSAVRTSLKRYSPDEIDDRLPDGRQRRLWRRTVDSFFPPYFREAAMLEERVGDHAEVRLAIRSSSPMDGCDARAGVLLQPTIAGALYKNVHVFSAAQLDRSPGGTGTSAMMAMLEARGRLSMNQLIRSEGLLGSGTFEGCLLGETKLGAVRAVRPTIKGTASILGTARWVIDRDDLVGAGFLVS